MRSFLAFLILAISFPSSLYAESNVAVITRLFGSAKVLSSPSDSPKKGEQQVLYDGQYYAFKKAKRGLKVGNGEVIQTGKGARARLVFENGDQVTVSSLSSYKISWDEKSGNSKPDVSLLMGSLRSSIKKGGPRSGMKVRTRSMVMGVRGTEFFVRSRSQSGQSEVTVLRGQVLVQPTMVKDPKPVKVSSGYSLNIGPEAKPNTDKAKRRIKVSLKKTTTANLGAIQTATTVKKEEAPAGSNSKENEEIAALEKRALESTLSDIKEYDPILHDRLKKVVKNGDDIDAVDEQIYRARIRKQTPKLKNGQKPDLGGETKEDVYEKYYTPL